MESPFNFTVVDNIGNIIDKIKSFSRRGDPAKQAADLMIKQIHQFVEAGGSTWGQWEPPAWRDGTPLFDKGQLHDSYQKRQIDKQTFEVFTDFPWTGVLEFGATIEMSPKQRKFLFANIPKDQFDESRLRGEGTIIIPERPLFRPGFEVAAEQFKKNVISVLR